MASTTTKNSTTAKGNTTVDNGYRALRMAKGYGRESLAAALGIRMADVWAIEKGATLSATDRKALEALPARGNALQTRTEPVNKPVRTKTTAEIAADAALRAVHPVTVARKGQGYTREGLAQAMGISTTALWHLEQEDGKCTDTVKAIKALPTVAKDTAVAPAPKGKTAKASKATASDLI